MNCDVLCCGRKVWSMLSNFINSPYMLPVVYSKLSMWWPHDIYLQGEKQQIKFSVAKRKVTNVGKKHHHHAQWWAIIWKETLESLQLVLWKQQLRVQKTNGILENTRKITKSKNKRYHYAIIYTYIYINIYTWHMEILNSGCSSS